MMFTYFIKQGKDVLLKLLTSETGHKHSVWKLLLLFSLKLPNIIGKQCTTENISQLWGKAKFICNSSVPFFTNFNRERCHVDLFRQMCSAHFSSYLSKFYSKGKCVFKKKVICIWVFYLVFFTCRCHSHIYNSFLKRITLYSAFSSHSKKSVGCAMMLMLRRIGVWTADWLQLETSEQKRKSRISFHCSQGHYITLEESRNRLFQ